MSNFSKIKLEKLSGGMISSFCEEAIEIRDKTGLPVEFDFNRISIFVGMESDLEELLADYDYQVAIRNHKFKIGARVK